MFDTHLHTHFSGDSAMTFQEAVVAADKKGVSVIVTEHMDLDYPDNPETFVFDPAEYFQELGPFRTDKILLGVELGLRPECREENRRMAASYPFDEIIGSIHVVDGIDIYRPQFTRGVSKKSAYGRYLASMLECIGGFDGFDSLGHVDYICRYAAYEDKELHLTEFFDEWTAVCQSLINSGKALEINTRRLELPEAVASLTKLYRRYHELGGRHVTIGSDAHRTGDIGKNLSAAWQMAEGLGLKPVYFKNRQMEYDRK